MEIVMDYAKTVQTNNASWTLRDGMITAILFSGSKIQKTVVIKEADFKAAYNALFGEKK